MLFNAKKKAPDSTVIPSTIRFKLNKKKGLLDPLQPHEKMLCALRKALADMSDGDQRGCRYFIANGKVQMLKMPTTTAGKKGEAQSYNARGRCRVGVCHPDDKSSSIIVEFSISYRDIVDDRGLADVEYFDPTTIDMLPKNTPLDLSGLS